MIEHGPAWLLADNAPWWLLTNYPEAHDVFSWLDGLLILSWIGGTALIVGGWVSVWLALAARPLPGSWRANAAALSYALAPLAGAGLFVGLTGLTATLAHAEGLRLAWLPAGRATLLALGAVWSLWLADRQLRLRAGASLHLRSLTPFAAGVAGVVAAWVPFVYRVL